MHNSGNYIRSLGAFCKWLSEKYEQLGVEIYPGFAASEPIIDQKCLKGIITNDRELQKKIQGS